jgi:hypothetical protein
LRTRNGSKCECASLPIGEVLVSGEQTPNWLASVDGKTQTEFGEQWHKVGHMFVLVEYLMSEKGNADSLDA